ncbi:hypothetical protein C1Y43_20175 [Pantoea sp. ICBG 828]|uniref:hypothetical protein n=1 Tax=unclassified Pantoea TaxID=2630326 RepID=UPI000CE454FB|nr:MULTISPECIES: hypothetical protein [unclassified Pantoea]NIG36195.1 hypothetical protein [Pantoea sp. Ap-959]PPC65663.1 hypothetical protein C1Y43_20175 [Pantoea sp. ICBG 828]
MDELKKKFEVAEKAIAVLTKLSFCLGSAIFMVYCALNGGFPDSLSLADSLRIFYIVTVFSLGTLFVYFFLMCVGLSFYHLVYRFANVSLIRRGFNGLAEKSRLVRNKAGVLRRKFAALRGRRSEFYRTYKRPRPFIYHVVFTPAAGLFHSFTVITLVVIAFAVQHDRILWYIRLACAALLLGLWFIVLDVNRQRRGQMKFVLSGPESIVRAERDMRAGNLAITFLFLTAVTFMLGLFTDTASQTMRVLGFRHDSVTVYVKKEWSTVLARHGIKGSDAELPPYASRHDNVTVALSSFGSSVTLQFHSDKDPRTQTLRVPATEVLIDPLHSPGGSKAVSSVN